MNVSELIGQLSRLSPGLEVCVLDEPQMCLDGEPILRPIEVCRMLKDSDLSPTAYYVNRQPELKVVIRLDYSNMPEMAVNKGI